MTAWSIQALEIKHLFSEKPGRKLLFFLIFCFVLSQDDECITLVNDVVIDSQ